MGSLLKGVFFDLDQAKRYASFFYEENADFKRTEHFQTFFRNQMLLVQKKWGE